MAAKRVVEYHDARCASYVPHQLRRLRMTEGEGLSLVPETPHDRSALYHRNALDVEAQTVGNRSCVFHLNRVPSVFAPGSRYTCGRLSGIRVGLFTRPLGELQIRLHRTSRVGEVMYRISDKLNRHDSPVAGKCPYSR